jgi:hypothetical protein
MVHEIDKHLSLRMVYVPNLTGLIDLKGRHIGTSVLAALHVSSDIAGNPVAHALVVDVCVLCNQGLVVIKIIIELIRIFFAQTNGSDLNE